MQALRIVVAQFLTVTSPFFTFPISFFETNSSSALATPPMCTHELDSPAEKKEKGSSQGFFSAVWHELCLHLAFAGTF